MTSGGVVSGSSRQRRRVGAVVTVAVMLACVVPAVALPIAAHRMLGLFAPDLGAGVAFAAVGAFLLVRGAQPGIAMILCGQGVGASATVLTGVLNARATAQGPLHGVSLWIAWLSNIVWLPGVALLVPLVLLFPDFRLAAPVWRWPIRVTASLVCVFVVVAVLQRASVIDGKPESFAPNPTGVVPLNRVARTVVDIVGGGIVIGFALLILVSLGAVIGRRRRARGAERAQLTCLLYGGALTVSLLLATAVLPQNLATFVLGLFVVAPVALAIMVAVLRYRLYEIDRVVSRTLAYAIVVAVLTGVYVGVVTSLVAVVPARFGQVGVAAATLAVSVLAVPLTRRVRRAVDRRFNRRRIDAQRLIDAYLEQLRRPDSDVTVDSIADGLVRVAGRAVEPRHISVWLAAPDGA